jgi:hypothetical protein
MHPCIPASPSARFRPRPDLSSSNVLDDVVMPSPKRPSCYLHAKRTGERSSADEAEGAPHGPMQALGPHACDSGLGCHNLLNFLLGPTAPRAVAGRTRPVRHGACLRNSPPQTSCAPAEPSGAGEPGPRRLRHVCAAQRICAWGVAVEELSAADMPTAAESVRCCTAGQERVGDHMACQNASSSLP